MPVNKGDFMQLENGDMVVAYLLGRIHQRQLELQVQLETISEQAEKNKITPVIAELNGMEDVITALSENDFSTE